MSSGSATSGVRRRIASLRKRRERVERELLRRRRMVDACLVERYTLAGGKQRKTPAYYLSRKADGSTRLTYVRKDDLARVRAATEAWRAFSQAMARWMKLNDELAKLMRELGRRQIVGPTDAASSG